MAPKASLRFYAELNDFLPTAKKQVNFTHFFSGSPAVKDLIESLGIPHTEVDLILVNGKSVDFSYRVSNNDRIGVFPVFESLDISTILKVRPEPLREPRFILDTHLGKLASYLRMLGFDTLYRNDYSDEELAEISSYEHRILLTRDRGLLKRSVVTHGYLIRFENPRRQVEEVISRFDLYNLIKPFTRCMQCNEFLENVSLDEVKGLVPKKVRENCDQFSRCLGCGKAYWRGTHYQEMVNFIEQLLDKTNRQNNIQNTL
ncbi:MAG: Mut7-C RNAse domain-containing protein [Bacillota bacterium]